MLNKFFSENCAIYYLMRGGGNGRTRQTTDELKCGAENVLFACSISNDNIHVIYYLWLHT
jgi:hypothetical protein